MHHNKKNKIQNDSAHIFFCLHTIEYKKNTLKNLKWVHVTSILHKIISKTKYQYTILSFKGSQMLQTAESGIVINPEQSTT